MDSGEGERYFEGNTEPHFRAEGEKLSERTDARFLSEKFVMWAFRLRCLSQRKPGAAGAIGSRDVFQSDSLRFSPVSRVEIAIERARAISPAPVLLLALDLHTLAERELCDTLLNRAPAHLIAGGSEAPASPATALQAVQRFALTGDRAPERSQDASVAFFSASSEALEFVEIARRALQSGVPFDRIAILLRNPGRHGPLVREALQRAGIPELIGQLLQLVLPDHLVAARTKVLRRSV